LVRRVQAKATLVSNHEETVTEISSTDEALFGFPKEIRMSQRDFKLFLVALESDEEPVDKLRDVADEYKRRFR
jgi:hypothetical protein